MGNRLSKIYTRTGDQGATGLADGSRAEKDEPRIEAIGAIDELNSLMGLLLAQDLPEPATSVLMPIQHELFDLGGELSMPGKTLLTMGYVTRLEKAIDRIDSKLEPLKEFVLPGGSRPAALCHVVRAVCRRAERRVVSLQNRDKISEFALPYLNRLSDLLFVIARWLNKQTGTSEVLWQSSKNEK